jgi:hypothetical protein
MRWLLFWASKADRGMFWDPISSQGAFSLPEPGSHSSRMVRTSTSLLSVQKNEEDEQWLSRLRNLGMSPEDELKLFALRDYISGVSLRQSRDLDTDPAMPLNDIISLSQHGVTPQTVFFDKNLNERPRTSSVDRNEGRVVDDNRPKTIADCLA